MSKWLVRMTFEGYREAATPHDAIADFKSVLGLAPTALRSELHLTELRTFKVEDDADNLRPDVEKVPE